MNYKKVRARTLIAGDNIINDQGLEELVGATIFINDTHIKIVSLDPDGVIREIIKSKESFIRKVV